ncbi:N-acetylmuramoyl-L-alanine amidase [Ureibacillus xyleni]|uniref:N-acetylmuramoyl-L-alanine amidase n=1 Tax=Ureibacillus xyleni TaxID=614648 RepID=A0A285SA53_9BACL|nr:SH3 domain-containing protein [Ureibacillus xyleni]SOC02414.1 N-acetylmuramoyl-L-alanine amidase [Ureibacillus xyleni]
MKKKILPFILTITLSFTSLSYYSLHSNLVYANNDAKADLIVSAEKLYLREGPGLSYPILTTLTEGQKLQFIEKQSDWYHVKFQDYEGWVASWLTSSMDKEDESASTNKTIISQVDHLNLRAEPSITSPVINQLNMGNEATVIQQQDNWFQVVFNGTTGWVATQYVSIKNNDDLEEQEPKNVEMEKSPSEAQVEIDPNAFTITVDAVNIRKKPNLSSKKIGIGKKGEQYEVLERDNNWVKIKIGNKKGWVYSFYGTFNVNQTETITNEKEQSENPASINFVTVIYNGTNLREAPSTSSNVVVHANAGEKYKIVGADGDWFEVEINRDTTAFVANWVVSLNEENAKIEKESEKSKKEERKEGTLKGVTIVIDPGHGGNDMGTTGVRGTEEKDINIKTAELLTSKLRASGAEVILTRESDIYVDLRKRVSISHQYAADAFISIHYDATEDSSISGFTTYYINDYQQNLAQYVHEGLAEKVSLRDRGVQPGNYLVLRENKQNAILIELGYLSNPNEERIVTTDVYREQATLGIYQGILNYFDSQLE